MAVPVLEKALQKILKPKYIDFMMMKVFADYQLDTFRKQDETDGALKNMLSPHSHLLKWAGSGHSFHNAKKTVATTQKVTETVDTAENGDDESKGNDQFNKC